MYYLVGLLLPAVSTVLPAPRRSATTFPLKVSADRRCLVDQRGRPFLVVGDSPWSLIVQPSVVEIGRYLDDRRRRGFNSVIVNLIEHKFASHAPSTRAGLAPFLKPGDFSAPNPAYFDYAHDVVRRANDRGIAVWLAPAYLGYGGGDEGWFREMKASGRAALRQYGRMVGARFRDLPNVVWLLGGDYTPPAADQWTVSELAAGIRETDPVHLMSAHGGGQPAAVAFGNPAWLDVNTCYSYNPSLFRDLLAEYAREPRRPFVLIETIYEGEHDARPEQIRRQAYWAMLCGACGQFFGNNPIWHFDGPGLFPAQCDWQHALGSQGSADVSRLRQAFAPLPWQRLAPDAEHRIVTDGMGSDAAAAMTAATADGRMAVTYVPSTGTGSRTLRVDLGRFAAPVALRWYNPCTGAYSPAADGTLANSGSHDFATPGDNGSETNDWLLILDANGGGRNAAPLATEEHR